ncbi:hypothetical protein E4U32_000719 [Claviceps aff. humidiphila group G2b]|nr:hypothetical protein E4U32_000719 [Claviceps aff. humidiphila group G2b]
MRSSFLLFGLAAVALANLNQNANEMRDVSDIEGSKVEADPPTKMFERARPCCSSGSDGCDCYNDEICCIQTHPWGGGGGGQHHGKGRRPGHGVIG